MTRDVVVAHRETTFKEIARLFHRNAIGSTASRHTVRSRLDIVVLGTPPARTAPPCRTAGSRSVSTYDQASST
ncbi:hypothetical protein ACFWIQ_13435 [Kitasatospora sp. NPDC127059]|uniref:hypothetical protein n=1 Tax=unclassified Kitasatospora TaxID=2633591 RepID=UPI0036620D12